MTAPDICPLCKADLTGKPIPEGQQNNFGGQTHWSRRYVVVDRRGRVTAHRCPDCNGTWPVEGQQK